ncbi:tetraspanin-7-like [Centruroides sculpturatus]|uniref:tetraspanin-7-like n=1 Tax=Centruroides sculpturatus TaxID=218467 RepID=UPI000C6E39D2|nr:tetraspanin-7-like [Centruroides sculpturatus]
MIKTYFSFQFSVIIFLIFIVELAVGISAYVFRNKISDNIKSVSKDLLENYNKDASDKDFWDDIQTTYNCCGIDGPRDWNGTFHFPDLPSSCCVKNETTCTYESKSVRVEVCIIIKLI